MVTRWYFNCFCIKFIVILSLFLMDAPNILIELYVWPLAASNTGLLNYIQTLFLSKIFLLSDVIRVRIVINFFMWILHSVLFLFQVFSRTTWCIQWVVIHPHRKLNIFLHIFLINVLKTTYWDSLVRIL